MFHVAGGYSISRGDIQTSRKVPKKCYAVEGTSPNRCLDLTYSSRVLPLVKKGNPAAPPEHTVYVSFVIIMYCVLNI